MKSKSALLIPVIAVGLLASCSDLGKSPTSPDGGAPGQLSVTGVTTPEGSPAGFNVTLASAVDSVVRFAWAVTTRSASVDDLSGPLTGTDSIPAGETSKIVSIPTINDTLAEASEVFLLTLSSPVSATISSGSALGIISASDGGVDISWGGSVSPILTPTCGGCHPPNGGGFSVASPATLMTTGADAPVVIPGDGANSKLIDKLSSTSPIIGVARMPLGGPYLSAGTIDLIRQWIDQGAQNN